MGLTGGIIEVTFVVRYQVPTNNQHIAACMYLYVGTFIVRENYV